MIKIYNDEVYAIDINYYNRMDILRQCWKMENCEKKKFLIFDGDTIIGAWSYYDIIKNRTVNAGCLELSQTMFKEARIYFEENEAENGACIPVFEKGECLFLLEYEQNRKYDGFRKNGRLCREVFDIDGFVDTTLLEGIVGVIFYELEEYTYIITNILRERFPEIEIIYLDEHAKLFFKDIKVYQSLDDIKYYIEANKYMHITSNYRFENEGNNYNSLSMMHALFSFSKIDSYGELNKDKTILMIDFIPQKAGLVDIIKFSCVWALIAYEKGWIPIINHSCYPNQYLKKAGENMWEYYFLPVSDISLNEALQSKCVISLSKNGLKAQELENPSWIKCYNKLFLKINRTCLFSNIFKLNNLTGIYIDKMWKSVLSDKLVLGVIMRGTDLRQERFNYCESLRKVPKVEDVLKKAKMEKERGKYDAIFLATEDLEYLELFKKEFGNDLLYIEQKRVRFKLGDEKKLVADLLNVSTEEDFAKQYLLALYTLSKCDGLITNTGCGAYHFATLMKEGKYRVNRNLSEETF